MNIFATSQCPKECATLLPDKHVVKMPLECCQMLAIIASKWYHNYGALPKSSGGHYLTDKGVFRNHPCTKWAAQSPNNARWLIEHGLHLCDEYQLRYGKRHSCHATLLEADRIFPSADHRQHTPFHRAMPEPLQLDNSIDTFTAYQRYVASKPWAAANYLRIPERKPNWFGAK